MAIAGRTIWALGGSRAASLVITAILLAACSGKSASNSAATSGSGQDRGVLNVANWFDEVGPDTYREFERRTGIHVNLEVITDNPTLETRLLAGHSGFDIVVPSNNFMQPLIAARALLQLDKSKLPNLHNLDAQLMRRVSEFDPDGDHSIPYVWGTYGIGMNTTLVTRALGAPPPRSMRLLFDPVFAAKLQHCGIVWDRAAWEIIDYALIALGKDPSSESPSDLAEAERLLAGSMPYVRYLDNFRGNLDLSAGEICIENGAPGGILQARDAARLAGRTDQIDYFIPDEGGLMWFDMLAIPADAPHLEAAYQFLNYLLEPRVIAAVTSASRFANANAAATPFVDRAVSGDPAVYPPPGEMARLHVPQAESAAYTRLVTRAWSRIRYGETSQ